MFARIIISLGVLLARLVSVTRSPIRLAASGC